MNIDTNAAPNARPLGCPPPPPWGTPGAHARMSRPARAQKSGEPKVSGDEISPVTGEPPAWALPPRAVVALAEAAEGFASPVPAVRADAASRVHALLEACGETLGGLLARSARRRVGYEALGMRARMYDLSREAVAICQRRREALSGAELSGAELSDVWRASVALERGEGLTPDAFDRLRVLTQRFDPSFMAPPHFGDDASAESASSGAARGRKAVTPRIDGAFLRRGFATAVAEHAA